MPQNRAQLKEERKKRIRKLFKNFARSAIVNRLWIEHIKEKSFGAKSLPSNSTGILTAPEKAILNKPRNVRTDSERMELVKLLANLLIFERLPPKLRARVTPYVYFVFVNPARKIIAQDREAITVYFILTGEVEVTTQSYSSAKNKVINSTEYISGPGDWLGEYDILEGTKRQHTYTSMSNVELLALDRVDFENILMPYVNKMWETKKTAIGVIHYFDYLTPKQVNVASQLGELRQYKPYESIYSEDKGLGTFVHFVISGRCLILQCLKMRVKMKDGRKSFQLVKIEKNDDIFKDMTNTEIRNYLRRETLVEHDARAFTVDEEILSADDIHTSNKAELVFDMEAIEKSCAEIHDKVEKRKQRLLEDKLRLLQSNSTISRPSRHNIPRTQVSEESSENFEDLEHLSAESESASFSLELPSNKFSSSGSRLLSILKNSNRNPDYAENLITNEEEILAEENTPITSSTSSYNVKIDTHDSKINEEKIEDYFINVGTISRGGIFGLGEQMKHRFIMAESTVQCFAIPRFWLMERSQNPQNIWERKRMQLDANLPSRLTLFQDFFRTRKWHEFKKNYVNSHVKEWRGNSTKIQDVPIIGRIISPEE